MRRREFLVMIGGSAALLASPQASSQQARPAHVGWLSVAVHPFVEGFRRGMRELGFSEGDAYVIDFAAADGFPERLPELAAALVRVPANVIVTSGSDALAAARGATNAIPIVAITSGDALGSSLARPSGNVTGIGLLFDETAAKWVQLILEMVPRAERIGVVFDSSPSNAQQLATAKATASTAGKAIEALPISNPSDIEPAVDRALRQSVDGLIFVSSPIFTANAARIVELAERARLPAVFEGRTMVEKGGLMSYGPNFNETFRHLASYVGRILKGARPQDLPIERPTKFELLVNLKTAKALGLTVPPSLLIRADEVIE